MTDYTKYGLLVSPFESFGYDKKLHDEERKKELFTDTKKYITDRFNFIKGMKDTINNTYKSTFDNVEIQKLPIKDRMDISKRASENVMKQFENVAEEIWPDPNRALQLQSNINVATEVVKDNMSVPSAVVKKPRKAKAKAKAPKAKKEPKKKTKK